MVVSAPTQTLGSTADSCLECNLVYKFCPSSVGCGYSDPSGATCYCGDWSWCRDLPSCAAATVQDPVTVHLTRQNVSVRACNASDWTQWLVNFDSSCQNSQYIIFSPRDMANELLVLSMDPLTYQTRPHVFASYVVPFYKSIYCSFHRSSCFTLIPQGGWLVEAALTVPKLTLFVFLPVSSMNRLPANIGYFKAN